MWYILDKLAYLGFPLLVWAVLLPMTQGEAGVGKGLLVFGFAVSVFGLAEFTTRYSAKAIKVLTYLMLLATVPFVCGAVVRLLAKGLDDIVLGIISIVVGVFGVARSASSLWLKPTRRYFR